MFIAHWSISLNSHSNPKAGNIISILTDEGTENVLENLRFPQSAALGLKPNQSLNLELYTLPLKALLLSQDNTARAN